MLNQHLPDVLSHLEGYYRLLEHAVQTNDFTAIEIRLNQAMSEDSNFSNTGTEDGFRYYKPFHHAAVPKIIEALKRDLPEGKIPTISLTFQEIDEARRAMGFSSFGSKQDVLYGFTSERYKKWGPSLTKMGFQSGCMAGEAEMVITMAPRYLELGEPDELIEEVLGGISSDFWETAKIVFGNPFVSAIHDLEKYFTEHDRPIWPKAPITKLQAADNLIAFLSRISAHEELSEIEKHKLNFLLSCLQAERTKAAPNFTNFFKTEQQMSQEQIGLKYADEGKYVQKILGGHRVEHLQSNVKMIKNPLRGNKCEVDSIYRILSEKKIVLLEAKGKELVSRAQLYQVYETFKLKLLADWNISVLVLLLTGSQAVTTIDMVEVEFDETCFGQITESLCALKPKKHYRWRIKQPS